MTQYPKSPRSQNGMNMGRFVILVTLLSVAVLLIYNTFFEGTQGYTKIPKDMLITYKPADFKPNINEDEALKILSNPQRYKREFDDLIYNFNVSLLMHVANRMGMPPSLRNKAIDAYKVHHPYLRQLYYNDFISMKDTTSNLYQEWYENESANAVDLLNEVASKYTCFFVNQIISTLLKSQDGKISVQGNKVETPCGVALTEALRPTIERLQQKAAIEDFSRAKGMMQEKVEKAIAELATMEVRDRKGLNKQMQTKVWGYSVSSSELEVSAISILKVGFKLDQYFDLSLDANNKQVVVTLPQPTILSHEVYPKVDKLDIGWLREVNSVDLNSNFNALREEFRRDAIDSDIMGKSKKKAVEIMQMIFSPVIRNMKGYKLKVRFLKSEDSTLKDDYYAKDNKQKAPEEIDIPDEVIPESTTRKPKKNIRE